MTTRSRELGSAAGRGAVAGLAGALIMTGGEKVEQQLTGRPNSYVPGRAMQAMMGQADSDASRPLVPNQVMHWGTAALLGALRGVWSATGIRGAQATATHTVVRLAFDQTVENLSGAGAPPSTWPVGEQVLDAAHKAVYSIVTGWVSDSWISPTAQSTRGRVSH